LGPGATVTITDSAIIGNRVAPPRPSLPEMPVRPGRANLRAR
jgi:hypothetical protein